MEILTLVLWIILALVGLRIYLASKAESTDKSMDRALMEIEQNGRGKDG